MPRFMSPPREKHAELRTLWHYLRDLAVRYPEPKKSIISRVTWLHFHEWCKRSCIQAGLSAEYADLWRRHFGGHDDSFIENDEPLDQMLETDLPALAERAITEGEEDVPRYDAILVDEGQDFNLKWWTLLRGVRREGVKC
jgi:superfamily I DNA and RNA helicase